MAAGISPAMKQMEKIVDKLYARQDVEPFREPVAWRELGLFDYPELIKQPMSLSEVKAKLVAGQYKSTAACADDVNLIWTNCMAYNMDGSDFYKLGKKLQKHFQDQYNKMKKSHEEEVALQALADFDRTPTIDEQTQFAHNLYCIKSEELGQLITKLDECCPVALYKKHPERDELEINIDAIDGRTFHLLTAMIRVWLPDKKGPYAAKKQKT